MTPWIHPDRNAILDEERGRSRPEGTRVRIRWLFWWLFVGDFCASPCKGVPSSSDARSLISRASRGSRSSENLRLGGL
jgi:hypothetical protein